MTELALAGRRMQACALPTLKQGVFEGYASIFDTVDGSGDQVLRGAFTKSLADRGVANIRMLFQHDPAQPIGTWLDIRQDVKGLYVRGRLSMDVQRSAELAGLLRDGAIDGLSIGFKTIKARRDQKTGIRQLLTVDLWEISLVTFPMLTSARVASLKAHKALAVQTPAAHRAGRSTGSGGIHRLAKTASSGFCA
ncbi:Gene Transfer Agent prohead protease [hydrothermal vent metagenome]|uniref:Gene Transfer Agent prohead protease n=1 Tax=hydrothermal vent metagenome TaxID=652676 RepID=A0A3B0S6H1_9ZZZZ